MRLAYYDESGDDGYPRYSSPLFVLAAAYVQYLRWQETFDRVVEFRRHLKISYGLPVKTEMHTRHFLLGKYSGLGAEDRVEIVTEYCELVGGLDIRCVNVAIVKPRIASPDYRVLDTALTYSVQRLENDLDPQRNHAARFILITDEGRVGKMRKTVRRIRRYNPIPSLIRPGTTYRRDISTLIEDPLPKDSAESHLIQVADLVGYVVYLYASVTTGVAGFPSRMPAEVDGEKVSEWMELLRPSLNTAASGADPYGVKFHPE